MNTAEVIRLLSQRLNKPQKEVKSLLERIIEAFRKVLDSGKRASIPKFGTFYSIERKSRLSFNPGIKKKMELPPKVIPAFRPSAILKNKVNSGDENEE